MKFDLHTHHFRCGHADGNIREYIEAGIANGLDVIGISDHTPYFGREEDQAFPNIAMAKSDFENYVNEVLELKREYEGRIDVLLGIESDYFLRTPRPTARCWTGIRSIILSDPFIIRTRSAFSIRTGGKSCPKKNASPRR